MLFGFADTYITAYENRDGGKKYKLTGHLPLLFGSLIGFWLPFAGSFIEVLFGITFWIYFGWELF